MATDLPSFEKAEYGTVSSLVAELCLRCQQKLTDQFYMLNGQPLCALCAHAAMLAPAEGGDAAFLQSMFLGFSAAVAGCILYAAVEIATGWTIGYVALAVGWLVGKGMKRGSGGRGGRRYQLIAVALTYCSVSCANLIVVLYALRDRHFIIDDQFLIHAAKYSLLSPLMDLRTGINGVIGLFILFIGMQAAWTLTAGSEQRITGPHPIAPMPRVSSL